MDGDVTYHVEALKADGHCHAGRKAVKDTGTHDEMIGALEQPSKSR